VAFRAPVLRSGTVEEGCAALRAAGFTLYGLDAGLGHRPLGVAGAGAVASFELARLRHR
jgi:23S rRNA (guanosine2251-2'-O)-methyltransferase